ncbi:MAG: molybdopterin molybdotransferase MoeA [Halieaceae bacterium]|nr:molybdopterin molybdotransferase MoeA [Halieaceae bacterium]
MTPLEQAMPLILADVKPLPAEHRPGILTEALGRVLAEDLIAPLAVPGDDNSAMDGYAVNSADGTGPLLVTQRITAGSCGSELSSGTAARIFTGAPIPAGADAVVMQENCVLDDQSVRLTKAVGCGENIRRRGQDIAEGEVLFNAGRRLQAQDLGVLASLGFAAVPLRRRLKAAILSTGDELVEPGEGPLRTGQIYNSNRYTLRGLLERLGIEVVDLGMVKDTAKATAQALQRAAAMADCVISSGGVSVGEADHVTAQVQKLGELRLWKLRIKPGKPLAFGRVGETPFFGLPGNPSAVFVTFCLVVRPWLLRRMGVTDETLLRLPASADFQTKRAGTREEYLRVRAVVENGQLLAKPHHNQSSGVLSSVSRSNALAIVPPGRTIEHGDRVEILLLDQL